MCAFALIVTIPTRQQGSPVGLARFVRVSTPPPIAKATPLTSNCERTKKCGNSSRRPLKMTFVSMFLGISSIRTSRTLSSSRRSTRASVRTTTTQSAGSKTRGRSTRNCTSSAGLRPVASVNGAKTGLAKRPPDALLSYQSLMQQSMCEVGSAESDGALSASAATTSPRPRAKFACATGRCFDCGCDHCTCTPPLPSVAVNCLCT